MPADRARVAVVHSFYASTTPSGENAVVLAEVDALRAAGYVVELFDVHTDELQGRLGYAATAALQVASGRGRRPDLTTFRPDVVHVHNLFPNYGTRWLHSVDAPVVATMHNFRPLCAAATLHRDGGPCTDCVTRSWPGLLRGCYRGSRLATLPLSVANRRGDLLRRADRVLVLNDQARAVYARAGVPEHRLLTVANFVPDDLAHDVGHGGSGWVVAGRLTPEKGILRLVERWPSGVPLTVFGSGPQQEAVHAAAAGKGIDVRGHVGREQLGAALRDADGLVFPSLWPEGFPLVYAEALAAGTPVLALPGSSVATMVARDGTGAITDWGQPLVDALGRALAVPRQHCRNVFQRSYSEAAFVRRAERVYGEVTGAPVRAPAGATPR